MTVNKYSWLNAMRKVIDLEIDHMDAPVFHQFSLSDYKMLLSKFESVEIVPERFPVATKVHAGWAATLFNLMFVNTFNALPKDWTRSTGHHLMAFATKAAA